MASISLKHIRKVYPGGVEVVPNLNLEIQDKEFLVLVGPSGCGKSTTLRMIAGLEEITDGELFIGENMVNHAAPKDRDIAMVFQSYALYPHMTVYKNMAFSLKLKKIPKEEIDQKVRAAAKILDLEHLLDRKPKALSGGQRQRVALGRAMVRDPAVFLLDEPLSNLDAKLRTSMRAEISSLHKKLGTTFVYVTHDQTEAMTMGDRIVVMKDGFIQQVDTPQNLYTNPCNLFVAGFIGSPQMNFLDVTLEEQQGAFFAKWKDYTLPIPAQRYGATVLREVCGKPLVLGIRPKDIEVHVAELADQGGDICMEVELAELMGSEVYVYATDAEQKIVIRAPSSKQIMRGHTIALQPDMKKAHLFDRETEKAISETQKAALPA